MRIELEKFLEKLGVSFILSPYETMPWLHYDEDKFLTCSAEVRMGPTGEDIEAEIQLFKDDDTPDDGSSDDDEDSTQASGSGDGEPKPRPKLKPGGREQILWLQALATGQDQWGPKHLRICGKNYVNEFGGWEEKGCEFFKTCVESLQMGEIPDFDELVGNKMTDDSFGGGGRRGRIGRKSPNIKPGQLLGMKK